MERDDTYKKRKDDIVEKRIGLSYYLRIIELESLGSWKCVNFSLLYCAYALINCSIFFIGCCFFSFSCSFWFATNLGPASYL